MDFSIEIRMDNAKAEEIVGVMTALSSIVGGVEDDGGKDEET